MDRPLFSATAHLRAALLILALTVALPLEIRAQCTISGPATAQAQQSFTLCAPSQANYRYEWFGPGVTESYASRCLTIAGLQRGAYEYVLVIGDAGGEIERCRHIVNVGGSTGGVQSCTITGPSAISEGTDVELCASASTGVHGYEWTGPGNFRATTSCVRVSRGGTYMLTTRNPITGTRRTCTHILTAASTDNPANCGSLGPSVLDRGGQITLCPPSNSNVDYRWTRPNGTTSTARCLAVNEAGTYAVAITNRTSGRVTRCTHTVAWADDGYGNPDDPVTDNCPRTAQFWSVQCGNAGAGSADRMTPREVRAIATTIDARSGYFNWTNDMTGFCAALNPPRPMTQRKRLARQYAALLANVAAGGGYTGDGESSIGLDPDTPVSHGNANTIGELIDQVESMLTTGRGNFNQATQRLTAINAGRGIGQVCE